MTEVIARSRQPLSVIAPMDGCPKAAPRPSGDAAEGYRGRVPTVREASCSCGQPPASVTGDSVGVSICHCLECQRRTGSPFGEQARFDTADVQVSGQASTWTRASDEEGEQRECSFCPDCVSIVVCRFEHAPDLILVPVGAFADPAFPPPTRSVWEERRHTWVVVPEGAERIA